MLGTLFIFELLPVAVSIPANSNMSVILHFKGSEFSYMGNFVIY